MKVKVKFLNKILKCKALLRNKRKKRKGYHKRKSNIKFINIVNFFHLILIPWVSLSNMQKKSEASDSKL